MIEFRLLTAWVILAVLILGSVALTAADIHKAAVPPLVTSDHVG